MMTEPPACSRTARYREAGVDIDAEHATVKRAEAAIRFTATRLLEQAGEDVRDVGRIVGGGEGVRPV